MKLVARFKLLFQFINKHIMDRFIFLLIVFFALSVISSAQSIEITDNGGWKEYKDSKKGISVLFPRMPILINKEDPCRDEKTDMYFAYAKNTVFSLLIVSDLKNSNWQCVKKTNFTEKNLKERISLIKRISKKYNEATYTKNELSYYEIKNDFRTYWLINDLKNKRWLELWVSGEKDNEIAEKFINSLKLETKSEGIEIGKGAEVNLGDENHQKNSETINLEDGSIIDSQNKITPIQVVARFDPASSLLASQNKTIGSVILEVVFLANGSVGNVKVIKGLPYDLTENSISAVKKTVFLPAKKNGLNVNEIKRVEYKFNHNVGLNFLY